MHGLWSQLVNIKFFEGQVANHVHFFASKTILNYAWSICSKRFLLVFKAPRYLVIYIVYNILVIYLFLFNPSVSCALIGCPQCFNFMWRLVTDKFTPSSAQRKDNNIPTRTTSDTESNTSYCINWNLLGVGHSKATMWPFHCNLFYKGRPLGLRRDWKIQNI